MKRTEVYKKTYKIETSRDPEARGEEYISNADDLTDRLGEICINQEKEFDPHKMAQDRSFLLYNKGVLIKIDVTGDKFDREYERTVCLEITPGNRAIPREITELLRKEGFKKI